MTDGYRKAIVLLRDPLKDFSRAVNTPRRKLMLDYAQGWGVYIKRLLCSAMLIAKRPLDGMSTRTYQALALFGRNWQLTSVVGSATVSLVLPVVEVLVLRVRQPY
jgi:hypothetical protein